MNDAASFLEHGWACLSRGDLVDAETWAGRALELDASHADAWFLAGVARHLRDDLAGAAEFYQRTLAIQPNHPRTLNNLGVLLMRTGQRDDAFRCLAQLIAIQPNDPDTQYNYANALAGLDRFEEAEAYYRRVVDARPQHFDAYNNCGAMFVRRVMCEEALPWLHQALQLKPDGSDIHNNLGLAYLGLDQYDRARHHLQSAVNSRPENVEAWINLGAVHAKLKAFAAAEQYFRHALSLRPGDAEIAINLGMASGDQSRFDEALAYYRQALEWQPSSAKARQCIGQALVDLCRFAEAEPILHEALSLNSRDENAHNSLGMMHYHLGQDPECEHHLDEAIRLAPRVRRDKFVVNRSFLALRQGDFAKAWPDYDLRPQPDDEGGVRMAMPRWEGTPLNGRTLLVFAEQGLGDTIHFLRYLPKLAERKGQGGRIVVEVQKPLIPLTKRIAGYDVLISRGDPLPKIDCSIPMMSLPRVLGSIDAPVPYLDADASLVERWRKELASRPGFKIGIGWQGDPSFRIDPIRSVPLREFEPIAKIPGVALVSLQKFVGLEQVAVNAERVPLWNLGPSLDEASGAFMDTAAVMKNLDLVITSDSAIAHLAGALGVPTWMATHHAPDWRWQLGREDCLWYPSLRLFRQTRQGQWADVFHRLADAVREKMAASSSPGKPMKNDALITVPISPGELLDKIGILEIKRERFESDEKRRNVQIELDLLREIQNRLPASERLTQLTAELKIVNESLWQIEEDIRVCEREQDFGPRFIALARSVYQENDRRAAIKRQINEALGSRLIEEKSYVARQAETPPPL